MEKQPDAETERQPDPEMAKAIEVQLEKQQLREIGEYDGVLGTPPEWMPTPLVNEFENRRSHLLDQPGVTHRDVLRWMQVRRDSFSGDGFRWIEIIPNHLEQDVDGLIYIQDIARLGKERGIEAYLGTGTLKVVRGGAVKEHNRAIAKRPRKSPQQPFHDLITKILKENPDIKSKEVLRRLEAEVDNEVIHSVGDHVIEYVRLDGTVGTSKIDGLSRLVSRLRKKISHLTG